MRRIEIRGLLTIENRRLGRKVVSEGVFTRNSYKLLYQVFNAIANEEDVVTVKDVMGNNVNINARLRVLDLSNYSFITNIYHLLSSVGDCGIPTGLYVVLTTQDYTPTPNDYYLPSTDIFVSLTNRSVVENPNNSILVLSGSEIAPTELTVKGAGVIANIFPYQKLTSKTCTTHAVLIDGFAVTPITFVTGDTITVTYRLILS